jgi:hypothetical protein
MNARPGEAGVRHKTLGALDEHGRFDLPRLLINATSSLLLATPIRTRLKRSLDCKALRSPNSCFLNRRRNEPHAESPYQQRRSLREMRVVAQIGALDPGK